VDEVEADVVGADEVVECLLPEDGAQRTTRTAEVPVIRFLVAAGGFM